MLRYFLFAIITIGIFLSGIWLSPKLLPLLSNKPIIAVSVNKVTDAKKNKAPQIQQTKQPLTLDGITQLIHLLPQSQRQQLLSSDTQFITLLQQQAKRQSLLFAAHTLKFDQLTPLSNAIELSREKLLIDYYIATQIQQQAITPPSDEQLRVYYQQHQSQFEIGERIPVWQIFFQIPETLTSTKIKKIEQQASRLQKQLKKGKINFELSAIKYSQHTSSNEQGGYMGIVKIAELIPEIKTHFLALKPFKIGKLLRTKNGLHIFKRGHRIPPREITFEQAKPEIQNLLQKHQQQQQRQIVIEQTTVQYPIPVDVSLAKQWRQTLLKNNADD